MSPLPLVAHLDHSSEHGGAELALERLVRRADGEWRPRLVLSGKDSASRGVFADLPSGVEVVRSGVAQPPGASTAGIVGAARAFALMFKEAMSLRSSSALRSAHVVHANTSRSAVVGALALLGSRTPFVVHLRDRVDAASLGRFGLLAFRLVVARRATAYIANSQSTADSVRSLAGNRMIHVITSPIGLDTANVPESRDVTPLRIGMVARLDDWKGQDLLIEAFAIADIEDRATLTFYGDAAFGKVEYAQKLKADVARLGLENVTFAGFVSDVQGAIDGLDICVQYSSRPEPLGQNVLQYLARGRVAVVADEGGPAEWVTPGENGIRVPPRDPRELAVALKRLVDDPELRARLARGAVLTPGLPTDRAVAKAHADAFRLAVG